MRELLADLLDRPHVEPEPERPAHVPGPAHAGRLDVDAAARQLLAAWEALLPAELPRASQHQAEAVPSSMALRAPLAEAVSRIVLAQALQERGRAGAALGHLLRARRIARQLGSRLIEHLTWLAEAHLALDQGEAGLRALRRAMRFGRQQGCIDVSWWRPSAMATLCARALEAGIEVEYVRRLIARSLKGGGREQGLGQEQAGAPGRPGAPRQLHAPRQLAATVGASPPVGAQPRSIAIVTLGGFQLLRDGRAVTFPGRAQRRPLELLQALIAFGSREVPDARLADALWPDADGDAAHGAFEVTLHRLRKLLGVDQALVYRGGRLTLDPDTCSVDLWELESCLIRLEARLAGPRSAGAAGALRRLAAAVLACYRGPFLGEGDEPAWAQEVRDRVRDRVVRAILAVGRHWEAAGDWEQAVATYQQGLTVDTCAEGLYQRLMAAYRHLGRHAEAVALYRRCCHALATHLGIEPGPVTQALGTSPRARAAG